MNIAWSLTLLAMVTYGGAPVASEEAFLPPSLPEEYSLSFVETYKTVIFDTETILVEQLTVGTQYWSLINQAQRAIVSSGSGLSSTLPSAALNRLTVTNFTDPNWDQGSWVVDLSPGMQPFSQRGW